MMQIQAQGRWFKDEVGRTLLLHGVNLGGSSKVPRTPDGATHLQEGFFDHRDVSFVGRPFPLEEADEHLTRLRAWGLTFLRLLITWEAVEHGGPGTYDEEYLDYLHLVVRSAAEHDLQVVIDSHQDMWGRFSGGDGAPGWTYEAVGMDVRRFQATGAAIVHQTRGDPFPRTIWSSNANRFACATMFTLFFGGDHFAPKVRVDGVPVQEFLQSHYLAAIRQVAERLQDLPNIVGYDTLNEPLHGYIGSPDVNQPVNDTIAQGETPTIYQGMLLAAGFPQLVQVQGTIPLPWHRRRKVLLNPGKKSLWLPGHEPIWKQSGVWEVDAAGNPRLRQPQYFAQANGQPISFEQDCFVPFVRRFIQEIRAVDPQALIFVDPEPAAFAARPQDNYAPGAESGIVHAPHWYDGVTLHLARHIPWLGCEVQHGRMQLSLGRRQVCRSFRTYVDQLISGSQEMFGGVPTLIGETGVPMNLDKGRAFRTGDFAHQVKAMDSTLQAMDANLASYTLWNYTADNTNARGDQWNGEDLSIFSRDQQTGSGSLYDGGRAAAAVVRPYACKVAGEPIAMSFDIRTRIFEFRFRPDLEIDEPTEIFLPIYHYGDGLRVTVNRGTYELDPNRQILSYKPGRGQGVCVIRVRPS
jgi:hypothetical protein